MCDRLFGYRKKSSIFPLINDVFLIINTKNDPYDLGFLIIRYFSDILKYMLILLLTMA